MNGALSRLYYLTLDAARSMRGAKGSSVLTAMTLGFSLAIFFLFLFIFINLESAVNKWGDKTHVVVYIKDSALKEGVDRLQNSLRFIPGVRGVQYVSKEAAMKELKAELKGHERILEGVDANPLPASFEIKVEAAYSDAGRVAEVVRSIKSLSWVDDVQHSKEWVEKLSAFLKFVELAAICIGVFLGTATVFIISNTIRLTVWARRNEIEVMRLVGATDAYIRFPFLLEGLAQGFVGGWFAVAVLTAGRLLLLAGMPAYLDFALDVPLDATPLAAVLVASGMAIGAASSMISTARFLRD